MTLIKPKLVPAVIEELERIDKLIVRRFVVKRKLRVKQIGNPFRQRKGK